jgi:hypothetical protein
MFPVPSMFRFLAERLKGGISLLSLAGGQLATIHLGKGRIKLPSTGGWGIFLKNAGNSARNSSKISNGEKYSGCLFIITLSVLDS